MFPPPANLTSTIPAAQRVRSEFRTFCMKFRLLKTDKCGFLTSEGSLVSHQAPFQISVLSKAKTLLSTEFWPQLVPWQRKKNQGCPKTVKVTTYKAHSNTSHHSALCTLHACLLFERQSAHTTRTLQSDNISFKYTENYYG